MRGRNPKNTLKRLSENMLKREGVWRWLGGEDEGMAEAREEKEEGQGGGVSG